ncbi:MAG: Bug family tripartite tricarboxylate transporter substrate binding protein [Burkholderiales bacterium]
MKPFSLSLCAATLLALSMTAAAQNFPAKPIRMVVPFAPGGPADTLGRLVGQKLSAQLGQPVVVENRGGAGGTIGMEMASRLPADGYALALSGASTLTVAPSMNPKLPYDPVKDFTPVINVAMVPYALAVNPVVPAKTVKELIPIAAKKPGYLSYGSSGTGSMSSLAAELLKSMSGTDIVHVPYKGTAPALTDVVGGHIDMMLADLAVIQPHAGAGKLRVLGVTSSKRSTAAREVPTLSESGLPGYDISPWFGVVAPGGLPQELTLKLNATMVAGLKSPEVVKRLAALGYEPIGSTPAQFAATMKSDIAKYAKIVKAAGIRVEM